MPLRISYWTGWLDPTMVAVSKEVFQLMHHFRRSYVFGISSNYRLKYSRVDRSFGVHPLFYPLFKRAIPFLEDRFDVSHVYTSLGDWHFLNALGRRPIVLTMTQNGSTGNPALLRKVARVVAETERMAEAAVVAGVPRERVSVIYPGVDLSLFQDSPPPPLPWKCLFASSPENPEEIHTKGVDLILELARREPELEITIAWRPFGKESDAALELIRSEGLSNLHILAGRVADMHSLYKRFHFTIAPFRSVGKPCPNSILEGLACGRPALVSEYVDIGDLIQREGAGFVFPRSADGIVEAFRRLRDSYPLLQQRARPIAHAFFDLANTVAQYGEVYKLVNKTHPVT